MTTRGRVLSLLIGTSVVASLLVTVPIASSYASSIASGVSPLVATHKRLPTDASLIDRFARERERFDELRDLESDSNDVFFPVHSYTFASHGPTKGYVWRRSPPPVSATRLDGYRPADGERLAYRPIGGGWYLYLEWGD